MKTSLRPFALVCYVLAACIASSTATAQSATSKKPDAESEAEARARMARRGAGIVIGDWQLRGIEPPSGVEVSTMPMFAGWLRKGLDDRLSLENGIGVWRRVQNSPATGGLGGSPAEEVQSWVVAQTTALRFFPFTDAGARFEPWVLGGAGFTLGIDDRETSGGGVLGGSAGGAGMQMVPAVSLQGGTGVELRLGESYGVTGGMRYQWTRFFGDFGGERTYQGPVYELGLTYKFRYR
ncbi:MAG TPA: hypothetical protein VM764_04625 [Gemmatimonadaceae bacterium]|nr:hypothetical protein [Gemmatimonadaceae bacterium]